MTIRTKEADVPEEFQPARLFLDDIEQIVSILRQAVESRKMDSHSTIEDLKIKFSFSIGGEECDDIQDLPKLAKSNRAFSIKVERGTWVETSLSCHPWYGTLWWSAGLTKEDKWPAFHKLQSVLQKRNRRWSTQFHSLSPFAIAVVGWLASLVPVLAYPLYKFMPRTQPLRFATPGTHPLFGNT